jgi:nucleoside-diphosphate-sugar epimerase
LERGLGAVKKKGGSLPTGLVGATGFVGSNLRTQRCFDELFNSTNIEAVEGHSFELLVCAAPSSLKWKANQEPEEDRLSVRRLMSCLDEVSADRVVLISTIDVYSDVDGVDEETAINLEELSPYSLHRRELELFLQQRFDTLVLRLPAVFGPGLRKNVVFDLMTDDLTFVQPNATMQFYDLARLWGDATVALEEGLHLLNLATEPITVRDLACFVFERDLPDRGGEETGYYDMRTRHSELFGGPDPYICGREEVLADLRRFVFGMRGGGKL